MHDKLQYFLTYADNNAVGYFSKQGFTTGITMPKEQVFLIILFGPSPHCSPFSFTRNIRNARGVVSGDYPTKLAFNET